MAGGGRVERGVWGRIKGIFAKDPLLAFKVVIIFN